MSLAFFDPGVSLKEKAAMAAALKNPGSTMLRRRDISSISDTDTLKDFVTENSMFLFKQIGVDTAFLEQPPTTWHLNQGFIQGKKICSGLSVLNDAAERGVGLVKDYINTLCVKEESFQDLLQVVHLHRKLVPTNAKKGEIQQVSLKFLWE